MERLERPVGFVDFLEGGALGISSSAQHDVLVDLLLIHRHRHLLEALGTVVAPGVLVGWASVGADHQSLLLNVLLLLLLHPALPRRETTQAGRPVG